MHEVQYYRFKLKQNAENKEKFNMEIIVPRVVTDDAYNYSGC